MTSEARLSENVAMPETFSSRLAPLELPDVDGKFVRLGQFWAEQPAIVVFLRHWG